MPSFATIPAAERNSVAQRQDPSPINQPFDLPAFVSSLIDKSPRDILEAAFEHFGDEPQISSSDAEDVVPVDMAWKLNRNVKVFSLDTDCLHPETYRFVDQARKHYGIAIGVLPPDPRLLEPLVEGKGLFSSYRDGHDECCGVRKAEPLKCKLAGVRAWAAGQRHGQNPDTRSQMAVLEIDGVFSTPEKPLYELNPLPSMISEEVWGCIRMLELSYNSLHGRGYISIDYEPCTRPVLPNQHEREGRWRWGEATHKECGLHASNLISKA